MERTADFYSESIPRLECAEITGGVSFFSSKLGEYLVRWFGIDYGSLE